MIRLFSLQEKREIARLTEPDFFELYDAVGHLIVDEVIRLERDLESLHFKLARILGPEVSKGKPLYLAIIREPDEWEYLLKGKLVDARKNPLPHHRVTVYDKDRLEKDFLGQTLTDAEGKFSLAFKGEMFKEILGDSEAPEVLMVIHSWDEEEKIFKQRHSLFIPQVKLQEDQSGKYIIDLGVITISL